MPRQVTAWACEFGCGRRVTTKRASVAKHEPTCFGNPARRACKTCRFESVDWTESEFGGTMCIGRECQRDDDLYQELVDEPKIRWDCPGWEERPSGGDDDDDEISPDQYEFWEEEEHQKYLRDLDEENDE